MALAYGIGGLVSVPLAAIKGMGPPAETLQSSLGQFYFDISTAPYSVYIFDGSLWQLGGNELATTTIPGIVEIDDDLTSVPATESVVPSALAAKSYSDSVVINAPVPWSETVSGIGELATEAEAVAVTLDNVAITPLKAAQIFASPPPYGFVLNFNKDTFSSFAVTGTTLIQGGLGVETHGTPLVLATDTDNAPIFLGTDGERVIRIGTIASASSVTIEFGTGDIDIGANAVAHAINIGSTAGSSTLNLNSGSGEIDVSSDLNLAAGKVISIKGGAVTDFIGTATLVDGTITVSNTNIDAADKIIISRSGRNGSPLMGHLIYTINAGVGFTVDSYDDSGVAQITDFSVFTYVIFRQI